MQKKLKKNGYHRLINQKTGQIKLLKSYKNGVVHGKIVYYWDNGQIRLSGQYDRMHRVGTWKNYDNNGNLIFEEKYNNKDKKNTEQLTLIAI